MASIVKRDTWVKHGKGLVPQLGVR